MKITKRFVTLVFGTVLLAACSKEENVSTIPNPESNSDVVVAKPIIPIPSVSELKMMLKLHGMNNVEELKEREYYFELDKDIVLPHEDLVRHQKYADSLFGSIAVPKGGVDNIWFMLTSSRILADIKLYVSSTEMGPQWMQALQGAVESWNTASPNCKINIQIEVKDDGNFPVKLNSMSFEKTRRPSLGYGGELGYAYSFSCGSAGQTIAIWEDVDPNSMTESERKNAVAHLIGHAFGLAHTGKGIIVPGTNSNPPNPEQSLMSEKNHPWYGFSADEKITLEKLFPKNGDAPNLVINPEKAFYRGKYTPSDWKYIYTFPASGTPLTVEWSIMPFGGGTASYGSKWEYSEDNKKTWTDFTPLMWMWASNVYTPGILYPRTNAITQMPSKNKTFDIKVTITTPKGLQAVAYRHITDNPELIGITPHLKVRAGQTLTWRAFTAKDVQFEPNRFSWELLEMKKGYQMHPNTHLEYKKVDGNSGDPMSFTYTIPVDKNIALAVTYTYPDGKVIKWVTRSWNEDLQPLVLKETAPYPPYWN